MCTDRAGGPQLGEALIARVQYQDQVGQAGVMEEASVARRRSDTAAFTTWPAMDVTGHCDRHGRASSIGELSQIDCRSAAKSATAASLGRLRTRWTPGRMWSEISPPRHGRAGCGTRAGSPQLHHSRVHGTERVRQPTYEGGTRFPTVATSLVHASERDQYRFVHISHSLYRRNSCRVLR